MDDISEQQEVANEIAEAISNPTSFGQDVDEDELLAELEELEQEELDKQLLDVGPTPADRTVTRLPDVPDSEPVKSKTKRQEVDDDDLAALRAWAN